ncbi:cobalt-precorrin-8 methylmutase [Hafnia alvei]|uniref:cobalt-precorrin-8 methylmutase n=1 Tax=Hafnia alvei TaxID=569 RepID=UPI00061D1530|nr:cobalt-precorrin-8 methylmutase [Hafnia alvei]KID00545.2 precorrin-8X methylmutase [Hafnia alvei]MBW3474886.1 cobalt-precorrin-8 methylmutase [Hafnia alvei]TBM08230.1 cobalt-precorrin-8 methylmutase [Hafnia alvei]TBM15181.1 cobalt-precorrin-8 methylmutase [Hafnia alvei]
MNYNKNPQNIEQHSFEIISQIIADERPDYRFADELQEKIIKRAIHTSADFEWLDILHFSPDVLSRITQVLRRGCTIYTDTTMALSGINKTQLEQLGCQWQCYISDPRAVAIAKSQGITRSMAAVDLAAQDQGEKLFVFGNAPTALFRLLELHQQGVMTPAAVIGVPVGFVGAAESKQALAESDLLGIAALGRKGGSNIAAAIVNAILYHMRDAQ